MISFGLRLGLDAFLEVSDEMGCGTRSPIGDWLNLGPQSPPFRQNTKIPEEPNTPPDHKTLHDREDEPTNLD
ncbi:hypothetical protein DY000_02020711 [Brassica cretica]|uniref:Uncharacterized protein n=1 Tax=Brassica cretica TaxID=69181 RepID=A0ABQ7E8R6_BRACR|nr:hypothetical protein DY000_02020711 [Brassica cretica]